MEWFQMLDQKFSLVLIAEYLPESLILLKDLLCWSIDDIVYFKHKARRGRNRTLQENVQSKLRNWNRVDVRLNEHFNRTLWWKIKAYGAERMMSDVALLARKNQLMKDDCVKDVMRSGDQRIWYPPGVTIESFEMNPNASDPVLCRRITRPENEYLELLQNRQRKRNAFISWRSVRVLMLQTCQS